MFSRKENTMDINVTQAQLDAWMAGELIQNAMPNLSAGEREFIKTGVTPQEWEDMFGGDEEEDEEDYDDEDEDSYDDYDGQPDEAQEWHDFDPDC